MTSAIPPNPRHCTESLLQCLTEEVLRGMYSAKREDEGQRGRVGRRESGGAHREGVRGREQEGRSAVPDACAAASSTPSHPFAGSSRDTPSFLVVDTSPAASDSFLSHSAALEVLYGKTFLHALDIVYHPEEMVLRYVEEERNGRRRRSTTTTTFSHETSQAAHHPTREDEAEECASGGGGGGVEQGVVHWDATPPEVVHRLPATQNATAQAEEEEQDTQPTPPCSSPLPTRTTAASSPASRLVPRSVYRVGDYILFSPYYCPCSAYAYQCIRKHEFSCCKHMLALRMVLHAEEMARASASEGGEPPTPPPHGLPGGGKLLEKVVSRAVFRKILQTAIPK